MPSRPACPGTHCRFTVVLRLLKLCRRCQTSPISPVTCPVSHLFRSCSPNLESVRRRMGRTRPSSSSGKEMTTVRVSRMVTSCACRMLHATPRGSLRRSSQHCSWTNVPAPTYVAPLSLTHQTILLSCRWVAAGRWPRVLPLCACRGEGVHASDGCRQISDEACRALLLGPGPGQSGTLGCGCWSAHLLHFSRQSALEDLKNCSIL